MYLIKVSFLVLNLFNSQLQIMMIVSFIDTVNLFNSIQTSMSTTIFGVISTFHSAIDIFIETCNGHKVIFHPIWWQHSHLIRLLHDLYHWVCLHGNLMLDAFSFLVDETHYLCACRNFVVKNLTFVTSIEPCKTMLSIF